MTTQCYYIVKIYNNGRYYFLSYYTKWEKQARPTMNMAVLFPTHAAASRAANTLTDVDSVEVEEICV